MPEHPLRRGQRLVVELLDTAADSRFHPQLHRWQYIVLQHSLHSIQAVQRLQRLGAGVATVADELAHGVEVLLLHPAVVVLAACPAARQPNLVGLAVSVQVDVDELRPIVWMQVFYRERHRLTHLLQSVGDPARGAVLHSPSFGPPRAHVAEGEGKRVVSRADASIVADGVQLHVPGLHRGEVSEGSHRYHRQQPAAAAGMAAALQPQLLSRRLQQPVDGGRADVRERPADFRRRAKESVAANRGDAAAQNRHQALAAQVPQPSPQVHHNPLHLRIVESRPPPSAALHLRGGHPRDAVGTTLHPPDPISAKQGGGVGPVVARWTCRTPAGSSLASA